MFEKGGFMTQTFATFLFSLGGTFKVDAEGRICCAGGTSEYMGFGAGFMLISKELGRDGYERFVARLRTTAFPEGRWNGKKVLPSFEERNPFQLDWFEPGVTKVSPVRLTDVIELLQEIMEPAEPQVLQVA
jgi:hypothetical protein